MDLKEYFDDVKNKEKELIKEEDPKEPGVTYVMSLYNREKNSVGGCVLAAAHKNAARVITDGTHRKATQDEIDAFLQHQEANKLRSTRSEQSKNRQYVVVVDPTQQFAAPAMAAPPVKPPAKVPATA